MIRNSRSVRRLVCAVGAGALIVGLAGVRAASAVPAARSGGGGVTNPYSPAYGHAYRHGVVPTVARNSEMNAWAATHAANTSTGPGTLGYGGGLPNSNGSLVGVTSGTPRVYLVFWGSQWGTPTTLGNGDLSFPSSGDPYAGAPYIQNLFKGLGTGGELWSGTMTQYCDGSVSFGATSCPSGAPLVGYPTGGDLAGVWYDNSGAAPAAATGSQLAQEAVNAAANFKNTTAALNRYTQYVILSPTGTDPDSYQQNGFCAWHDYTNDGYGVSSAYGYLAFTNMPYVMDAGTSCGMNFVNRTGGSLDGYSIVEGHEYAETLTDQFPAGGWTNLQSNAYNGEEVGDECAWIRPGTTGGAANVQMGNGKYAMQSIWSNDTNTCAISHSVVGGSGSGSGNTVTVGSVSNQTGIVRTSVTPVAVSATDSGGQSVTWTASGLPPGLSIKSTGLTTATISGTPTHTGTYSVKVTATDVTGASGSTGFTWTIKR